MMVICNGILTLQLYFVHFNYVTLILLIVKQNMIFLLNAMAMMLHVQKRKNVYLTHQINGSLV